MPKSRSEEAYERIRLQILEWELKPGTELREQDLALALNVSRTPIRDALQRLAREGLVRLVPSKGAFVSEVSIPDVIDLFEVREALEAQASRIAARSESKGVLAELRPQLRIESEAALDDGDTAQYYELTAQLGHVIISLADNPRLSQALEEIWMQVYRVRRMSSDSLQRLRESIEEHDEMIDAILAGDEDAADKRTRIHLRNGLRHILRNTRYLTGGIEYTV